MREKLVSIFLTFVLCLGLINVNGSKASAAIQGTEELVEAPSIELGKTHTFDVYYLGICANYGDDTNGIVCLKEEGTESNIPGIAPNDKIYTIQDKGDEIYGAWSSVKSVKTK